MPAKKAASTAKKAGQKPTSIQAKKRATRVTNIQKRRAAGLPHSERARIYLGKTNTNIIVGDEDVAGWTEEELIAGRRQSKNGTWSGRPPVVVPKKVHDELVKRTLNNAQEHMRQNLEGVVQVLSAIAMSDDVPPKDRLKAIQMIMDRVMGKVPDTINLKPDMPWVQAITDGIVPRGDAPIPARSREVGDDD